MERRPFFARLEQADTTLKGAKTWSNTLFNAQLYNTIPINTLDDLQQCFFPKRMNAIDEPLALSQEESNRVISLAFLAEHKHLVAASSACHSHRHRSIVIDYTVSVA